MAYRLKKLFLDNEEKAFSFIMRYLGFSMREAQRFIDKKRLYCNGELVKRKSALIKGEIGLILFKPSSKGLKPIFQTKDFALFDKPSGVLVHPKNRKTEYSLVDEIRLLFGKDANPAHRIDRETSGLILVGKRKEVEIDLKLAFENKKIKKGYFAFVKGKIENQLYIDEPILTNKEYSKIKLKVYIDKRGKSSQTIIKPIKYLPKFNITQVEAIPLTGRQHQIRVHLFHVKHPIVGDPIYGVETNIAADYLDNKLSIAQRLRYTGSHRLMLQAQWIEFDYKNRFRLYSKQDFNFKDHYEKDYF